MSKLANVVPGYFAWRIEKIANGVGQEPGPERAFVLGRKERAGRRDT